jgi:uncharacterized protein (TIGR00730 family)
VKRICVFSGSRPGARSEYQDAAQGLGEAIAELGMGLVYGGASVGLMRTVADAALSKGGPVTGVIPRSLVEREVAHDGLSDLRVVGTMHERKGLMAQLADGFVALPGGFGTLDELFEIVTWSQLGLHQKPIGLLDAAGFWRPLVTFLEHVVREGFVPQDQMQLFLIERDPRALLDRMRAWTPPRLGPKWIDAEDT